MLVLRRIFQCIYQVTMAERNSVRTSESRKKAQALGFRSALEKRVADALKKARIEHEYEPRDFTLDYVTPVRNAQCADCGCSSVYQKHTYLPDFVLKNRTVVLESKGIWTAESRAMHKVLAETYKNITFVLLFQNPHKKISKRVTYSGWCDINNILWLSDKSDWIPRLKEVIKNGR